MSEDFSVATDAQLARWAYGRAATQGEVDRAREAALELGRRAHLSAENRAEDRAEDREQSAPHLSSEPRADQVDREGERVSFGPRALATVGYGTIMAYRSVFEVDGGTETDLVCVAAVEYNRRVQSTSIADQSCVARSEFERRGISTTLYGIGGQYDVDWGPVGDAQLDVLISESQRLVMEPGCEAVFIDTPASERDQQYVSEQLLIEQTGLSIMQLRALAPLPSILVSDPETLPEPPPDSEWITASLGAPLTGTESDGTGDEGAEALACLAVVNDGIQRESSCLPVTEMTTRTVTLEFTRGQKRVIVTWPPSGDVSVLVTNDE